MEYRPIQRVYTNKPSKISYSKSISKSIQRSNVRADKDAKKAEKFEIKRAKAQYANDKKQLMQRDLGVVQLVFGIIFAIFLISFIVNLQNPNYSLPTFANFLELINDIPQAQIPNLDIDKSLISIPIIGDILGFFTQIANAIVFLLNGVVQVVLFAFNFIGWIFNL